MPYFATFLEFAHQRSRESADKISMQELKPKLQRGLICEGRGGVIVGFYGTYIQEGDEAANWIVTIVSVVLEELTPYRFNYNTIKRLIWLVQIHIIYG